MKKYLKHIALLAALLLILAIPVPAFAAGSAAISVSASSVTIGNTVKVTLSFSGGGAYIAGVKAYVSYSAAQLTYTGASGDGDANMGGGSGTIVLETSSTSKSTLSLTLSFTATAAGDATVSITGSDIVDWDGNTIGNPTAGKTISVKAQQAQPQPPAGGDQQKPVEEKPVEPPKPTDIETAIEVEINGEKKYLWRSLENVTTPEGFTSKTIVYNGEQVQAAYLEKLNMSLLYCTDSKGENGKFFIYGGYDAFEPYETLTVGDNTYILLTPGEDVVFPEGYEKGEVKFDEQAVAAWIKAEDSEYCYLYMVHLEGQAAGLYLYDRKENTVQRVNPEMYALLLESQQPQEEPDVPAVVEPVPEEPSKNVIDRILEDDGIMMVMLGVLGVSLLLIVIMASILVASKRKSKVQRQIEKLAETAEVQPEDAAEETDAEEQPEQMDEAAEESEEAEEEALEESEENAEMQE